MVIFKSKHLRKTYLFLLSKGRLKSVFQPPVKGTEVIAFKNIILLSSCLQNTTATLKLITTHCTVTELNSQRLRHILNKQIVK